MHLRSSLRAATWSAEASAADLALAASMDLKKSRISELVLASEGGGGIILGGGVVKPWFC